ncbi:hypothetical protein SOVF_017170 [Spinacia oleracea]|nr:hypothetical protein SOVF_017170 [Spinacia oleracea]
MAEAMLKKIGNLIKFDERSRVPGFKRWIRAIMWVRVNKPLIPGCFFEYEYGKSVWVDFRYEGVFHFCKRCGKIGHYMVNFEAPWHQIRSEVNRTIIEASDLQVMYGRENAPLYTNKIKGLPNYDNFRTTRVAFGALPPLDFYGGSDYDSDGGSDPGNDGGDEAGPSRRRRRRKSMESKWSSSSSSSGERH